MRLSAAAVAGRSAGMDTPAARTLVDTHPELAAQLDPERNGALDATCLTAGSSRKVWWRCPVADDHRWQARVANRSNGSGCPACAGKQLSVTTRLDIVRPDLAAQWDHERNGDLHPSQVLVGTGRKVWWRCSVADDHRWQAVVVSRTANGFGCPFCSGNRPSSTNSLAACYPQIAAELDQVRSGVAPEELTSGSGRKVWWRCTAGHSWMAPVNARTRRKRACPNCPRASSAARKPSRKPPRKPSREDSLGSHHPALVEQVVPERNGGLTAYDLHVGSNRRITWSCPVAADHVWDTTVRSRVHNGHVRACPACSGRQVSVTNRLDLQRPDLATQLDPDRNRGLQASDLSIGSRRKVTWSCPIAPDHLWTMVVAVRVKSGTGCPACAGHQLSVTNSLATREPELAAQLAVELNDGIDATMVTAGSTRKLWWRCPVADDHVWRTTVNSRAVKGTGCPACRGLAVSVTNRLDVLRPDVAAQLDEVRSSITAAELVVASSRRVWWRCLVADDHVWRTTVNSRTVQGTGCPACTGKQLSVTNRLDRAYPEIAIEFDPDLNDGRRPDQVLSGSNSYAWWRCRHDRTHIWRARIAHRTRSSSGCPRCCLRQTSRQETELAAELQMVLGTDPEDRGRVEGWRAPVDFVDRRRRLIVEWDGSYWHCGREEKDRRKSAVLTDLGWTVIRLREAPLTALGPYDRVVDPAATTFERTSVALEAVQAAVGTPLPEIEDYITGGQRVACGAAA